MKIVARNWKLWAFVALAGLLIAAPALADSHARIVRLSYVSGDVSIDRGHGAGTERAIQNMPIVEGAKVWTGGDGQAEVEFEDGSTMRIVPNTALDFTQLVLNGNGNRLTTVAISGGTAYVDVPRLQKEDEFTFQLPNRQIRLDHSAHFRIAIDGSEAYVAVLKGEVDLAGGERALEVKKNETATFDLAGNGRANLIDTIAALPYDSWDHDRDDILRSAGFNRNNKGYPYGYGYADLMNYGSFMNVSGFGSCWQPFGVGTGWDPFDFGYWAYYPQFGYTWVSGYPWGWAPYRYGGWAFTNNVGWTWCPNHGNWSAWNVIPAVVVAPPRWHPPRPPVVPAGGGSPIIPVGHRGPGRYPILGGRVSDAPGASDAASRRPVSGSDANNGVDGPRSHFSNSGERPSINVTPPSGPIFGGGSGVNTSAGDRGHAPRSGRGIDLTPPTSGGSGVSSRHPIEMPPPQRPMGGPAMGRSGERGRSSDAGGSGMQSPRMSAPRMSPPSAPASSGRFEGSGGGGGGRMSAPSPMPSAPGSAPSAPAPSAPPSGGGHHVSGSNH